MKPQDIIIGLEVGVRLSAMTDHPREVFGTTLDEPAKLDRVLRGIPASAGYAQGIVRDVGVPYSNGRHGVVVEFTWTRRELRRCTCSQCGDQHVPADVLGSDDAYWSSEQTEQVTVHYSTVEPWEDCLIAQTMHDAEWATWAAAERRRQQRGDAS